MRYNSSQRYAIRSASRIAALDAVAVRRSCILLGLMAAAETIALASMRRIILPSLILHLDRVGPLSWIIAAIITLAFVAFSTRGLPLVREHLFEFTAFKWLALIIAVPSGLLEELFFRQTIFNLASQAHESTLVQIMLSAVTFGLVHVIWGIRGGLSAMLSALLSTSTLGFALALLYLLAGRAVLPCVIAHFSINLILEPWLIYAYIVRSRGPRRSTASA